MKNQVHYYVSSYLLCSFTYLEIATLSLVDASSSASNGSTPLNTVESSKHEVGEELRNTKSQGHSKLPNFEGEFQVLESTKLTSTGSKKRTTTSKRVTKPPKKVANLKKAKPETSSKISKKKKSKTKKSNAASLNSEEEEFNLSNMESDEDILRKATERTSTTVDDYEWDSEDDWDTAVKRAEEEKRLPFDLSLSDSEVTQTEPTKKIKSSTQTTTRRSQSKTTTHSSSSLHQTETQKTTKKTSRNSTMSQPNKNKTSKFTQKALTLTTSVTTPEPDLRGFESASVIEAESASVVEADSASIVEYEDRDPEDYSLTYVNLDEDEDEDEDVEIVEEYNDSDANDDESDYTYDEDHSVEDMSDGDYIEYDDDESIRDESKSPEFNKPNKGSAKRKKKLKEKKKWIKGQKRDRKMEKQKRRKQSMDGMRVNQDEPRTRRRQPGRTKDQSRATRLGIRRKMSGRHYGRNAGKEVYWSNGRKFYKGPRRKFGLRGKAKINARIYKPPKTARRG